MDEKRNFTRIQFDAIASLMTESGQYDTNVIDISLKGALIANPAHTSLEVEQEVVLKLTLSDNNTHIEVQGKITHIEESHIGLVCEHMDVDSASHLRRIVELNTGNNDLLERELEALSHFTDLSSFHET
ncbi:hypothetical protein A9Q99_16100 [Gammaproteobacteria bacterium 45_16_T64]|nr:hypothetical protein A9Q99_16100 [Gammaproteobacteria bacterium 45_16_T64]